MKRTIRVGFLIMLDIALVNFSLGAAYLLRFDGDYTHIPHEFSQYALRLALAATAVKLLCFILFRLYSSLWKYASVYEMVTIVMAALVGNAVFFVYVFVTWILYSQGIAPKSIFIITFFIDIFLVGGVRFAYRALRRIMGGEFLRAGETKRVLVVGGGDAGAIIIRELMQHPELKSTPIAIIDDDRSKKGRKINGVPIMGQRSDIARIAEDERIDEIIIAIPSAGNRVINDIFNDCLKTRCKVKILPSVSQLIDESVVVQKIRDVSIEDLLGRDPVRLDVDEIASYLEGQVVLVTGGGGSIGSELCRQVASYRPKQLIVLDNYENNAYDIQNELLYTCPDLDLAVVIANIRERHRMEAIFGKYKPDVVFHAAAHKHVPLMEANPTEAIKNNVFGTLNIAECSDKYMVRRFVLISTDKAVNPTNIMGATKRIAELVIQGINRHSSTEFVAVRFGNVLGSNGSVIPLFRKQIEQGGPVTVTHPEIIRYFMTIQEAVQLVIQAGAMAAGGGEIFVLDMGQPVKIHELARKLIKLSGFEPDVDIKIEFTGLRPGEKLYEELLLAEEGLRSTKNDKIFIAQPVFTDLAVLMREIDYLKELIVTNADEASDYIRVMVPTYKKAQ